MHDYQSVNPPPLRAAKKLKEGWNKFVDRVKYKRQKKKSKKKKMKMIEQELIQRAMDQHRPMTPEKTGWSREASSVRRLPVSDTVRAPHNLCTRDHNNKKVLMEKIPREKYSQTGLLTLFCVRSPPVWSSTWPASRRT